MPDLPFPKEVWVLGIRFAVDHGERLFKNFIDNASDEEAARWRRYGERMLHEGVCSFGKEKGEEPYIAVKGDMSEQYQRDTAMHELVHAVDHQLTSVGVLNEELVQKWGSGLFATLTDPRNRAFVEWVLGVKFQEEPHA